MLRRLGGHLVNFGGYPIGTLEPLLLNLPISLLRPPLGRFVIAGRGNKAPSLQIDLDRGKARSEVRWLNGAVAARAPEVGLWAPANQVLFSCLDAVIAGREPRQRYRGKPNALLDRWEQARGSG